jgi:hypothetical protein
MANPKKKKAAAAGSKERLRAAEAPPRPAANPYPIVLAAWLVPGAGHFLLGDRRRAYAFCALLLLTSGLGWYFRGNLHWDFGAGPLTAIASLVQLAAGLAFFVLQFVLGHEGDPRAAGYEYGGAFLITAGLLNIVLMLNAYDLATGALPASSPEPEESAAEREEGAAP